MRNVSQALNRWRVASLVNEEMEEEMEAGNYRHDFDAGNFSTGVYFYKLTAEGFTETKKMMLVK